ncbi:ERMIN protein, partial [Thinocorus orbignyianus]|nr:ERMIN protein [Thinocorus orbignyianus]
MTEEVPVASTMPECNGNIAPEKGPLQVIDEIAKSVGTVPYTNAETSPEAPPAKENQQENRNSLAEDVAREDVDGEKQCQGWGGGGCCRWDTGAKAVPTPSSSPLRVAAGPGREGTPSGTASGGGEPGTAASPGGDTAGTPAASPDGSGNAAEEEEEEEELEEVDTEEDEVQVVELKKEKGEEPRPEPPGGPKEPPAPAGPNCPAEKAGEQHSPGKKNDISRHSYSRYNTISYRRIRKGNTKQRIDEFESMMHL